MNILSIDPSVRNIGVAILQLEDKKLKQVLEYTWHCPDDIKDQLVRLANNAYIHICRWIGVIKFDYIVIEYPQFMMGDKGLIAAQRGYTIDLAFISGYLAAKFNTQGSQIFIYTPMQWKGTKPKSATQAAYERLNFGTRTCNPTEHSIDAAMLGHFFATKAGLIRPDSKSENDTET
jgi:Holliday junction resolvasome RuvABC endonuclease subunit